MYNCKQEEDEKNANTSAVTANNKIKTTEKKQPKSNDDINEYQFDENVVNKLVNLGIAGRVQCIIASSLVYNYKDIVSVLDKVEQLKEYTVDNQQSEKLQQISNPYNETEMKRMYLNSAYLVGLPSNKLNTMLDETKTKTKIYNDTVINQLLELGIASRSQWINASMLTKDYNDPNAVYDTLQTISDQNHNQNTIVHTDKIGCLQRIINALKEYDKFLEDEKHNIGNANNSQLLMDFHYLLNCYEDEAISDILIAKCNNGNICKLSSCQMMQRNYRERHNTSLKLKKMYSNYNAINDIISQQILDTIHCHYFHSFEVGCNLSNKDKKNIQRRLNDDEKENKMNDHEEFGVYDSVVSAISECIKDKKKTYGKIQGLDRLNSESIKFMTKTEPEIDINLRYSFGVRYFYWDYYKNNVEISDPARNVTDIQGIVRLADNTGYCLKDFYVAAKYPNLKIEITNNAICVINVMEWDTLLQKATAQLKTGEFQGFVCNIQKSKQYFNISTGTAVGLNHLVAMMLYCNYDELQRKFSETYRRIPKNESIKSVIMRHINYAHLGRLLRELVECFTKGNTLFRQSGSEYINRRERKFIFFHGLSIQSQFASTEACVKGPISTTTDYAVAVNFCGNTGMILEFTIDASYGFTTSFSTQELFSFGHEATGNAFWPCQNLSDFPYEKEIFFIGGKGHFIFKSIISAVTGHNYKLYVAALTTISQYACGHGDYVDANRYQSEFEQDENFKQLCFRLVSHQLHIHYPNNKKYAEFKSMPLYAKALAKAHFASIKYFHFNEDYADNDDDDEEEENEDTLCYFIERLFMCYFFYDTKWIKLDLLVTVFPCVERILYDLKSESDFSADTIYLSILMLIRNKPQIKLREIQITHPSVRFYPEMDKYAANVAAKWTNKFHQLDWSIFIHPHLERVVIQSMK